MGARAARRFASVASVVVFIAVAVLSAAGAQATTVQLSSDSSDPSIPADTLLATLQFEVSGGNTLEISLTNESDFDIRAVFFNAPSSVTDLDLSHGPRD